MSGDARARIESYPLDPESGRITGPPIPVLESSLQPVGFDVSPDGERIVFRTVGVQEDLYVIRADGSDGRPLRQVMLFNVESDSYKGVGDVQSLDDTWLAPHWLGDGRRAVLRLGERILLMDMESGEVRVLADDLNASSGSVSLPRDGNALYTVRQLVEGDIWLAELK